MSIQGHNNSHTAPTEIDMMERSKSIAEVTDDIGKRDAQPLEGAQEENAVGYKEYVEARDLDISDKEVSRTTQAICSSERIIH